MLLNPSILLIASSLTHLLVVAADVSAADPSTSSVEHPDCRLFLAESTIPNAGLGIFTGVPLQPGSAVAEPDLVIPLHDFEWHASAEFDFYFLWYDYSWNIGEADMDTDMVDGSALVLGTGCMPNCNFALINAHEGKPDYDHVNLHRSKDPGTTGFTGFYNQRMLATRDVPAGGEMFVDYGEPWFDDRLDEVGPVPFLKNYKRADKLLKKLKKLSLKYQKSDNPDLTKDLWEVIKTQANYDTRNSNALPITFEDMQNAQIVGSAESRLPYGVRSLEWLSEHGRCMDNIRPGNSTIEQAGRGAFATRFIPKGGLVAPGPVLHIANRTTLNVYDMGNDGARNKQIGRQLLLNYCFGHAESSVLLCPYTSPSAYINHNSGAPNARVVWADETTLNHNSYWLEEDVNFLKTTAKIGLSLDFIATRDIQPGEEVFIDYGDEWEEAWHEYVRQWSPSPGADDYVPASFFRKDLSAPLLTETEQLSDPYPDNIIFYCHYGYKPGVKHGPWNWIDEYAQLPISPCKIVSRTAGNANANEVAYYYEVALLDKDEIEIELEGLAENGVYPPPGETHTLVNVPRWAIQVRDKPYTKDEYLANSFRHEMMLPDEIFPETWKNNKKK